MKSVLGNLEIGFVVFVEACIIWRYVSVFVSARPGMRGGAGKCWSSFFFWGAIIQDVFCCCDAQDYFLGTTFAHFTKMASAKKRHTSGFVSAPHAGTYSMYLLRSRRAGHFVSLDTLFLSCTTETETTLVHLWKTPGFPPKIRLPSTPNTIPVPEPR